MRHFSRYRRRFKFNPDVHQERPEDRCGPLLSALHERALDRPAMRKLLGDWNRRGVCPPSLAWPASLVEKYYAERGMVVKSE